MKILMVTPYPACPGADGGGTVMFNLIRHLAARHEIVYLSFARQEDLERLAQVAPYCAEVVTVPLPGGAGMSALAKGLNLARRVVHNVLSYATLTPVVVRKCQSRAMDEAIRRAVERHKPDAAHLCFPQMAHYIEACAGTPAVMDTLDVALVGVFRRAMNARRVWEKLYYLMQWLFWVRYESRYFPRFGKVLTVTRQDAAALTMAMPDLDVYAEAIAVDAGSQPAPERDRGVRIGFLASFGHPPNTDAALYFAESVLPLVRERMPDALFVVAGRNPPRLLLDLKDKGVTCLGFVDDVSEFYGSVDVVVAPIRYGGGIKIKVLEAMACGKPLVATSVGAEGITEAGEGAFLVADDPAAFAGAVIALLSDKERRAVLGERARQVIERRFSWHRLCDDLDTIYRALDAVKR
ncbi:glycosyltransferase family 4 protein [Geobacter sp. AOG2]|uniref:glycosyltransferase family 4 protein n=1 Tax=Geobacter sp. AOG2 TaxID=1566347 RepID=UPI001CC39F40|nr:glycosyltransferase family 4 protein [Geobacter sp. AOG2]GFE60328.1 glycosyl transferase family 1 [Geobacter sp. AOG2]